MFRASFYLTRLILWTLIFGKLSWFTLWPTSNDGKMKILRCVLIKRVFLLCILETNRMRLLLYGVDLPVINKKPSNMILCICEKCQNWSFLRPEGSIINIFWFCLLLQKRKCLLYFSQLLQLRIYWNLLGFTQFDIMKCRLRVVISLDLLVWQWRVLPF